MPIVDGYVGWSRERSSRLAPKRPCRSSACSMGRAAPGSTTAAPAGSPGVPARC